MRNNITVRWQKAKHLQCYVANLPQVAKQLLLTVNPMFSPDSENRRVLSLHNFIQYKFHYLQLDLTYTIVCSMSAFFHVDTLLVISGCELRAYK